MSAVKQRPSAESLRKQLDVVERKANRKKVIDISGIVVSSYQPRPWLNITALARDAKAHNAPLLDKVAWNMTWGCIKRSNPALADLISSPEVKDILNRFNGSLAIDCNQLHKGKATA